MMKIYFTNDDLVRLRIADAPDPMWEVLLSLHLLQAGPPGPIFQHWRDTVRRQLSPALRPLFALAPPHGYSPDFLTPEAGADGFDSGIEGLLSTRRHRLRTDLRRFAADRTPASWARPLAEGNPAAMRSLAATIRHYHRVAVAPYWSQIRATIDAEREARARVMTGSGIEAMLGSLHPDIRWRPPVLEVHGLTVSREINLDGRGLRLVPSFFCWQRPTLLRDPELPPVLVYPVEHRFDPLGAPVAGPADPVSGSLPALLGRTRAAVLDALRTGGTTTELAQRVGVSPATASEHAGVLRGAGLISTRRLGGSVLHTLRPLGAEILASARARQR